MCKLRTLWLAPLLSISAAAWAAEPVSGAKVTDEGDDFAGVGRERFHILALDLAPRSLTGG